MFDKSNLAIPSLSVTAVKLVPSISILIVFPSIGVPFADNLATKLPFPKSMLTSSASI